MKHGTENSKLEVSGAAGPYTTLHTAIASKAWLSLHLFLV